MTGNIENLKVRSDKPDLKLSERENILSEHLKIQNIKDKELKDIRISITNFSNEISELDSKKIEIQGQIDSIKSDVSDDEKGIQEIIGQVKVLKEQFSELGLDGKSILDVNIDYDLVKWKKRESEISATINRMGPINMAAIDQFKEYEERKSYLSMQEDDLITALNSLEDAIRKIDKDTKERFKSTFV